MDYEYRPGINATLAELKAENGQLRAALKRIADYERGGCLGRDADEMIDIARDTLGTDEQSAPKQWSDPEGVCGDCGEPMSSGNHAGGCSWWDGGHKHRER